MAKKTKQHTFAATVSRTLAVSKAAAGAGVLGLIGFAALFLLAAVFFVTESYFLAMLLISFALLVYVTGAELIKLLWSSITVFFSKRHLIPKAAYLQETLPPLEQFLQFQKDATGWVKLGPIEAGAKVKLPDNPLVRDIQIVLMREKDSQYAEYIAHAYYVECRELYDHFSTHLDFVAAAMPLFGLIGTIIGLIGMFDTLDSDVTVEMLSPQLALALKTTLYGAILSMIYTIIGSRFEQRLKALEYDFETFGRAIEVLVDNQADVEVNA